MRKLETRKEILEDVVSTVSLCFADRLGGEYDTCDYKKDNFATKVYDIFVCRALFNFGKVDYDITLGECAEIIRTNIDEATDVLIELYNQVSYRGQKDELFFSEKPENWIHYPSVESIGIPISLSYEMMKENKFLFSFSLIDKYITPELGKDRKVYKCIRKTFEII